MAIHKEPIKHLLGLSIFLGCLLTGPVMAEGFYGQQDRHEGVYFKKAKVLSVQPIYENVVQRHPVRRCEREINYYRHQSANDAGRTLAGAAVGAIIGQQLADRRDRVAGAVVGAVAGAAIATGLEERSADRVCRRDFRTEQHRELVGYWVHYEYHGHQYRARMNDHPGRFVQLRVEVSLMD